FAPPSEEICHLPPEEFGKGWTTTSYFPVALDTYASQRALGESAACGSSEEVGRYGNGFRSPVRGSTQRLLFVAAALDFENTIRRPSRAQSRGRSEIPASSRRSCSGTTRFDGIS